MQLNTFCFLRSFFFRLLVANGPIFISDLDCREFSAEIQGGVGGDFYPVAPTVLLNGLPQFLYVVGRPESETNSKTQFTIHYFPAIAAKAYSLDAKKQMDSAGSLFNRCTVLVTQTCNDSPDNHYVAVLWVGGGAKIGKSVIFCLSVDLLLYFHSSAAISIYQAVARPH